MSTAAKKKSSGDDDDNDINEMTANAAMKQFSGDDDDNEMSAAAMKKSNNVTIGTMREVKQAEGDLPADTKKYVYRDFSQIPEEDFDVDYEIDQEGLLQALDESTALAAAQTLQSSPASFISPSKPIMRASGWVRSQRFPVKLYALLSQPNLASVISWMPHGRSWKVHKPRMFEAAVLPFFFESDNYHSFNRVINAWSFRRKSSGPDRGAYFHELFLRGKPHLQKYMRRLPRTHKKLTMSKEEEPDFFDLDKTSPLPSLEEARAALERRKVQRIQDQLHREQEVVGPPIAHVQDATAIRLDVGEVNNHIPTHANPMAHPQMAHTNMYFPSGAMPPRASFPPCFFPAGYQFH